MVEVYVTSDVEESFQNNYIDETNPVNIVKQKIRMLLFTNKGDVYGEPGMGVGLENYVFEFDDKKDEIISECNEQIEKYIGENSQEYDIKVSAQYIEYSQVGYIDVFINDKLELRYTNT